MLKYYVCWLLLMSAVTFFLMGWDKHLARCRRRRIPERVLLSWAAAGGALGGVLAMQLFRHKTLHRHFSVGMPVMLAVQLLLAQRSSSGCETSGTHCRLIYGISVAKFSSIR